MILHRSFSVMALGLVSTLACGAGVGPPTSETSGDEASTSAAGTTTTTTDTPTSTGGVAESTSTDGETAESSSAPPGTESGTMVVCGDGEIGDGEVCDGAELDGKDCAAVDEAFIGGELACAADCLTFDVSGCEVDPMAPLVTLNEVLSKSATEGMYADKGDAIELYNAGGMEADMSGWKLSDDPTFPVDKTYVFPIGTKLAPGEWLVLVELDAMLGEGDLPFGISSASEETLMLVDGLDEPVDTLVLQGPDAEVSWCRLPDGVGTWQKCDQTLGMANVATSADCGNAMVEGGEDCDGVDLDMMTCEGLGLGFTGGTLACSPTCTFDASMCTTDNVVAINELESTADDIEIYNAGNAPVDLSGWILTDDMVDQNYDPALDLEKLVFPPQTSLAAKKFLVIKKGNAANQHIFGLSADGDTVTLLEPNLSVVDQVSYGLNEAMVSYCRLPDGPGGTWTTGCMATLGAANKGP